MTVHAPTDFTSITIPQERGGCGQSHEAEQTPEGQPSKITCEKCEPHIIAARLGFSHDPISVALTCDELGAVEAAERSASREQNKTMASLLPMIRAQFLSQQSAVPAVPAPSLLEQIQALGAEDRAALAAMLTPAPAADAQSAEGDDKPADKSAADKPPAAKSAPAKKTTPPAAGK